MKMMRRKKDGVLLPYFSEVVQFRTEFEVVEVPDPVTETTETTSGTADDTTTEAAVTIKKKKVVTE